ATTDMASLIFPPSILPLSPRRDQPGSRASAYARHVLGQESPELPEGALLDLPDAFRGEAAAGANGPQWLRAGSVEAAARAGGGDGPRHELPDPGSCVGAEASAVLRVEERGRAEQPEGAFLEEIVKLQGAGASQVDVGDLPDQELVQAEQRLGRVRIAGLERG